ncbi:hypothetical protein PoB_000992200 [Plakobranchus ocellatus]|uniref:Uncharacterized protein n=1 Tax=Plakobranchus ocellatus TaxID=259542 RepID=A0AAV3YKJ0_9GAST|nr:hypothetical protein PoB_000992200 [Plakobranchus ocellatus]
MGRGNKGWIMGKYHEDDDNKKYRKRNRKSPGRIRDAEQSLLKCQLSVAYLYSEPQTAKDDKIFIQNQCTCRSLRQQK